MASVDMIPKTAPTPSEPNTPPRTPTRGEGPTISPYHVQQLLDILDRLVPSKEESKPVKIDADNENEKARVSMLEFKIVNEMYVSLESE
jgi:hypothetical protein